MRYNKVIFTLSIAANIVFIMLAVVLIHKKGGIGYLSSKIAFATGEDKLSSPLIVVKENALSVTNSGGRDIVFLGDSHTDYFEWGEYLPDLRVSNQGIAGDRTENVLNRVNLINAVSPKKVFIMIGINDLQSGTSIEEIIGNYKNIVSSIQSNNPNVEIYIQSVFHVNADKYPIYFGKDPEQLNGTVSILNDELKELTGDHVTFVDVDAILTGGDSLNVDLTIDGLHLSDKGYELWLESLREYTDE